MRSASFSKDHPDYTIHGYVQEEDTDTTVWEYAPSIFRNIRKGRISEHQLLQSFIPNKNMTGMYNFKTGGGKSPCFFFFSDNNMIMLKTLKGSEHEIIFEKGFLLDYFKYILANPDTLLMKILGVFEMQIGQSEKMKFILTDNMVGLDKDRIQRCFDLKGSLHGRLEKVTDQEFEQGTGLRPLKDINFMQMKNSEPNAKSIYIEETKRNMLLEQMHKDSMFLCKHALIDYSVFLLQVDREKML